MTERGLDTDTKYCPYCAEAIRKAAVKCRYCGSRVDDRGTTWYRSTEEKMIAGVCGGLAEQWGISVTVVRLAFLLGTLVAAWGLVVYIFLWIIMPKRPRPDRRPHEPPWTASPS